MSNSVQKYQNTSTVRDSLKYDGPMLTLCRENHAVKICSPRNHFEITLQILKQCNLIGSVLFLQLKSDYRNFSSETVLQGASQ